VNAADRKVVSVSRSALDSIFAGLDAVVMAEREAFDSLTDKAKESGKNEVREHVLQQLEEATGDLESVIRTLDKALHPNA
jgi:cell shape-determining protein MreC